MARASGTTKWVTPTWNPPRLLESLKQVKPHQVGNTSYWESNLLQTAKAHSQVVTP